MLNEIFEWLNHALAGSMGIALAGSFLWGVLSILLSPCHLSSIPLIIGYINKKGVTSSRAAFNNSLIFSLGILVTIAVIGIATSLLGRMMGDVGTIGNYIVALVFFIAGLYLLDLISLDRLFTGIKEVNSKGYKMAFTLGLLFGIGLGPCTFAFMAPVIGVAFHYSSESLLSSFMLLSAFALGHCLVITGAGTASTKITNYFSWSQNSRGIQAAKKICGVLVILGGVYFIYLTF
ncbi:MAG: cytochrome C biogenesis protein [Ignavibacteria bacterium]|nr:cytochrome C biogenesis protein [Ignavibacteria bacterium]